MSTNAAQLWSSWLRQKDGAAFEKLVLPELPATYDLARRMGLGNADSEDVVQESLAELAQTRSTRPAEVGVGAWLMRSVRMRSLMRHRSRRRRKRHEHSEQAQLRHKSEPESDPHLRADVERALERLPADDRQILVFRFLYDLEYREIAYVLGISENACRIRVHRASEKLRGTLGKRGPTLLAALPLPAFHTSASTIAAATKSAGLVGGLIMGTGMKMAAAAAVGALLTAGAFLLTRPAQDAPATVNDVSESTDQLVPHQEAVPPVRQLDGEATLEGQAEPTAPGSGRIAGRVTLADGSPLAGVVVIATPVPPRPVPGERAAIPAAPDLEAELREATRKTRWRVTRTRRATTGTDGRYVLPDVADGDFHLRAYANGYRFSLVEGRRAQAVQAGVTVDFTAMPVVRVHIEVVGADPAERVTIRRASTQASLKRAGGSRWTPGRPFLHLAPGTYWLQAAQGREAHSVSAPEEVTLALGEPEPRLRFVLGAAPGLRGRVVFESGLQPGNVDVYVLRWSEEDPPETWRPRTRRGEERAVPARYDRRTGRYHFRDLAPGRYLIGVTIGGLEAHGLSVLDFGGGPLEHDIHVSPLDGSYTTVRPVGPDGSVLPVRGTSIRTHYRGAKGIFSGGGEAIRREDGSWIVRQHSSVPTPGRAGEPLEGRYTLEVSSAAYGTRTVEYDPRREDTLMIRFEQPVALTVDVPGLGDSPVAAGVRVQLWDELPRTYLTLSNLTASGSEDRYAFEQLQPGTYRLALMYWKKSDEIGGIRHVALEAHTIQVRAGKNTHVFALPDFHDVRVDVPAGSKAPRLGLRRLHPEGDYMHQFAPHHVADGEAMFRFVPPGRYAVVGNFKGEKVDMTIEVPQQTVIRLE